MTSPAAKKNPGTKHHPTLAGTFNLKATVQNGVIDIWGFAPSLAERTAIRVAAEGIPGVMAVNDHLLETPAFVY
ncbi:BON domain-containing protein [Bradyrhizobium sp. CCBAU 51745]|uniref:BON domain-containing protein n=1 Tax=Bradyrhizobium sp. CCBAU 51745 TaxID=1325099 RepID=UPI002306D378|nr:BON domain-containing protein [Bradyrhizobium sp. CCBAU 51745]